jgi:hypothetical protein
VARLASFAASVGIGAALTAVALVAKAGGQLGSSTGVEIALILGGALIAAAAIVWGREGGLSGAVTLVLFGLLTALTALSVTWSITPDESWIEANRTLSYLAVFAASLGVARLAPSGPLILLRGLILAGGAVLVYALAGRVWPSSIAPDELYSRLSEPLGYWNAIGCLAAMMIVPGLWLGARRSGHAAVNALAYPFTALMVIALFLSFSRGAILAALIAVVLWLLIVPLRLRSITVLAVSAAGAAPVLLWALSKRAFTESQVPLPVRERVADDFGVLLLVMIVLTLAAGLTLGFRINGRAPSMKARLRFGSVMAVIAVAAPIVMFAALVTSDPGIDQRLSDLTNPKARTPGGADRFTAASSSRSIYWKEAREIFADNPAIGTGAGTFGTARLPYRDDAFVSRQAHGFVPQTAADFGVVGLVLILLLLVAWLVAAARATGLRPRRDRGSPWTPDRIVLCCLAASVVAFGVSSAIDWTWFVPAPTVMALAAAGCVAGARRSPLEAADDAPVAAPRRALGLRIATAAGVVIVAGACAWAVYQPALSENKVDDAYDQIADGRFQAAADSAKDARDINPLSLEAWWASAAVADASGDQRGSEKLLRDAVGEHRTDPRAWLRLAQYQLYSLGDAKAAEKTLVDSVLKLDPNSREAAYAYFESRIRQRGGGAAGGAAPVETTSPQPGSNIELAPESP